MLKVYTIELVWRGWNGGLVWEDWYGGIGMEGLECIKLFNLTHNLIIGLDIME